MNQNGATTGAPPAGKNRTDGSEGGAGTLVTVAVYARLAGIHRSTVSRQIKTGLIPNHAPAGSRPSIDPVEANAARASGLDHGKRRVRSKSSAPAPTDKSAAGDLGLKPPTFSDARVQKEQAQAGLAELTLEERAGRLVDRGEVERAAFEAGKVLRERVLAMPTRLAGELVTMVRGGGGDREVAALIKETLKDTLRDVGTAIEPAPAQLS